MAINHDVGKEGEEAAVQYLINKGYEIVIRNYYADKAELDIVALKDGISCVRRSEDEELSRLRISSRLCD
jgi:Holliday junction resolvase-like predicted endonuclease